MTKQDILQNLKTADTYELVFLLDCYTCDSDSYPEFPIRDIFKEVTERYVNGEFFEIFEYLLLAEKNDTTYACCKKAIDAVLSRGEPEIPSFHLITMFEVLYNTLVYGKENGQEWVPVDMDLFWKWNDEYIAKVDEQLDELSRVKQITKEACIKSMVESIVNR